MNARHATPPALSDEEAWDDYRRTRSEDAFRRLVERHLPVVWAVALRTVNGERALAEDVAQEVFADLARLAPKLPARFGTGGWLHRRAFFTASKAVRAEVRRRAREHTAAAMHMPNPLPEPPEASASNLVPLLDAALASLAPADREVLVLRYLQQRSVRDVGVALGLTEETARKRLSRALEKLRATFRKRGIIATLPLLGSALLTHAAGPVPATLGTRIAAGAWGAHMAAPAGGVASWLARLGTPTAVAAARWGERAVKMAGVLAVVLLGAGWWGCSQWSADISARAPATLPSAATASRSIAEEPARGQVRLDFFIRPKSPLDTRLLRFRPGIDDAALWQELSDPAASGWRTLTIPLSPGGHGRVAESTPQQYATDFAPREDEPPPPVAYKTRDVGTIAEVRVSQEEGVWLTELEFTHHRGTPGEIYWPLRPGSDEAIATPHFHPFKTSLTCPTPPGQPVLVATTLMPPYGGLNPAAPQTYALLFLTFEPVPGQ